MKWLIFLLLVSCGKHQQPNALDVSNPDGDKYVNEEGIKKYFPDIAPMGKISGIATINGTQITFNNDHQDQNLGIKFLLTEMSEAERKAIIDYDGKLSFSFDANFSPIETNTMKISFQTEKQNFKDLVLVEGQTEKLLGTWNREMSFTLSKAEILKIKSKKAYFLVRQDYKRKNKYFTWDNYETLNENNRRVIVQDGENIKILLVAKTLPESKLLSFLTEVSNPQEFRTEFLFDGYESGGRVWFQKHTQRGDIIFVHSPIADIRNVFEKNFEKTVSVMSRKNGMKSESIELKMNEAGKAFIHVRPLVKKTRTFTEKSWTVQPPRGAYIQITCHYKARESMTSSVSIPSIGEFIKNQNDLFNLKKNVSIYEGTDERGPIWKILVTSDKPSVKLELFALNASSYIQTGVIETNCDFRMNPTVDPKSLQTEEEELSFEVQIYSEKK